MSTLNPQAKPFQPTSHHLQATLPFLAQSHGGSILSYSYQQHHIFPWQASYYHLQHYYHYYGQNIEYVHSPPPTSQVQLQEVVPTSQLQVVGGFQSPPPTSQPQEVVVNDNSLAQPNSSSPQENTRCDNLSRVWVRRQKKQGSRRRGGLHSSSNVCNNNYTRRILGGERERQVQRCVEVNDGVEKKKHEVIEMNVDEPITTIVIKNIPYSFSRDKLIRCLDNHCLSMNEEAVQDREGSSISAYDLVYLPIDFRTKQSRGFAFVNFTNPKGARRFYDLFHNQRVFFGEILRKGINIACAKFQGKESLVNHYGKSIYETETDEYLAVCFSPPRDGSIKQVRQTTLGILNIPRRDCK